MLLFNWFVPAVFGIAPISFVAALGLRYVATYWLHPPSAADFITTKSGNTNADEMMVYSICINTLLLIGGALIHYVTI